MPYCRACAMARHRDRPESPLLDSSSPRAMSRRLHCDLGFRKSVAFGRSQSRGAEIWETMTIAGDEQGMAMMIAVAGLC
jgi:hypothetical protein